MNIKCIVIDDENHHIDTLSDYIHSLPGLKLIKSFTNPKEALEEITSGENVDIIFTDIEMPSLSGIELSKAIKDKTKKLVFTTAHSKYAYEAFESEADAYLLKPYSFAKFEQTVNRLCVDRLSLSIPEVREKYPFFFVKNKEKKNKLSKILYEDIVAIESFGNYVKIYTMDDSITTYLSFDEMKTALTGKQSFMQVHRSFIISINFIEMIDGDLITLFNQLQISIGKTYKEQFYEFINKTILKTKRNSLS